MKPELLEAVGDIVLQTAEERQAFLKARTARREGELARVNRETQELIRMRAQSLITDKEFLAQKAGLSERRIALESAPADDAVSSERIRQHLREITAPLAALCQTWHALPEPLRGRFVRCLMPAGFVAGEVRTAELALLFRVFGTLRDTNTNAVALVGKSWNCFCEEISGFAALLREAAEVYGGSIEAVRKSS